MNSDSEIEVDKEDSEIIYSEDSDVFNNSDVSDSEVVDDSGANGETPEILSKKRIRELSTEQKLKRQKKFEELKIKRKLLSESREIQYKSTMSKFEKAAYLWSYILESESKNMTELEKQQMITEDFLLDTPNECIDDNLALNIQSGIEGYRKIIKKHKGFPEHNASPYVLVLSMSAIRCTEVLKKLTKMSLYIPKLFGKHMSIEDQEKSLNRKVVLAVGTPGRILQLCNKSILNCDEIKTIIIDMKENEKRMNILSLPETRKDFIKFYMKFIHKPVIEGNTKLLFI